MGRHSKPTRRRAGKILAVVGSGAFALPATTGTAMATSPGINWDPIIQCESGGNPRAHNVHSTASGLFQFLSGTWRSLGGLAFGRTAADASPAEQMEIANRAYATSGLTPWEASRSCWRRRNVYDYYTPPVETHSYHYDYSGSYRSYSRSYVGRHRAIEYTVHAGDTLSSIAATHGHTWRELFNENRRVLSNPNLIDVGVVITL